MNTEQHNTISRGRFFRAAGLITAGFIFNPRIFFMPDESPVIKIKKAAAQTPVTVSALRGNIHVLEGSGGNITVFDGKEGIVMIDAGIAVSQHKITDALSKISTKPLKYLINTHWHFDHTDGNKWIHATGAKIIAHENTKKNLSKTIRVKDWDYTFTPYSKASLPAETFQQQHTLKFNDATLLLNYYPPAHTDCDISVYFPHADVLVVADTWWNPYYPFIDHDSGGSLDGMINATNHNLDITTDKTIIIPGHGAIGNRSELLEYRDMLVDIKEKVSALKKAGNSLSEAIAAKPTAAYDAKFGKFVLDGDFFTRLVYADV